MSGPRTGRLKSPIRVLDSLSFMTIFPSPFPTRGAFCRTLYSAGRGRRPLLRLVIAAPGGLGSPSVPTTRDCLQWLDAARTNAGESLRDQGGRMPPVRARKHGPEAKNRRCGAPEGDAPYVTGRARRSRKAKAWTKEVAPLGAPLPRCARGQASRKAGRRFAHHSGACARGDDRAHLPHTLGDYSCSQRSNEFQQA